MSDFWSDKRVIVALALSILTLAEIVDLTIVSVALPHIMGALQCNINEVSLTMTSYIVASAVFIPLTGFVSKKYGAKNVSLASAFVFGVASILCGMANSLAAMVVFRLIQGIGGAFLPSMSQAYIANEFTPQERPKVMMMFSLCVVLGPIIGPIFGGFIVEHMSWRWIFYVNIPICILGFSLVYFLMDESTKEPIKTDYLSFLFMALGVGCLEFFLDEGNQNNWFESKHMVIILATGVIALGFFIWRGLLGKSVVTFKIFKSMNFVLSCVIVFAFMMLAVLNLAYFPTLLQQAYGYPVDLAGYITAPRGVFALLGAPIFMFLAKRIDPRKVMMIGLVLFISSGVIMYQYGANQSPRLILITCMLQGLGLTGTFLTLIQAAFTGLGKGLASDASGVFNFFRNIGNSVGTSVAATLIARNQQISWNSLAPYIANANHVFNSWLPHTPLVTKIQIAAYQVQQQAFLIANLDVFLTSVVCGLTILVLPMFLDKPVVDDNAGMGMH